MVYYIENNGYLSNGDTVKISIEDMDLETMVNRYGKIPSRTEMEYTVEGLGEYVRSFAEIRRQKKTTMPDTFSRWMRSRRNWTQV